MGLTYAIAFGVAIYLFGESFSMYKLVGILLIMSGIYVLSRSAN